MLQTLSVGQFHSASWDDINEAMREVVISKVQPPIQVLLNFVEKKALAQVQSVLMANHAGDVRDLVATICPYPGPPSGIFDTKYPKLAPLLQALDPKVATQMVTTILMEKIIAARIRAVDCDSKAQQLSSMCSIIVDALDVPDDSEPHPFVLELVEDLFLVCKAITFVVNPAIGADTDISSINDAVAVYDASEVTTARTRVGAIGGAIKSSSFLEKSLDLIVRHKSALLARGAELQKLIATVKKSKDQVNSVTVDAHNTVIQAALKWASKYSCTLPPGICGGLETATVAAIEALFQRLCCESGMRTSLATFQLLVQQAISTFPMQASLDALMHSSAEKLRDATAKNFSDEVVSYIGDLKLDDSSAIPDAATLATISARMREKGGMFEAAADFDLPSTLAKLMERMTAAFSTASKSDNETWCSIAGEAHSMIQVFEAPLGKESFTRLDREAKMLMDAWGVRAAMALASVESEEQKPDSPSVLKLSGALSALQVSKGIWETLGGTCKPVADMLLEGLEITSKMGEKLKEKYRAQAVSEIELLTTMARCSPPGEEKSWLELSTDVDTWDDFVTICQGSLLAMNKEEVQRLFQRLEQAHDKDKELTATYHVKSEPWDHLEQCLSDARVTQSAFELMSMYISTTASRAELRTLTRTQISQNQRFGISKERFPGMLVKRMLAANKMQGPP